MSREESIGPEELEQGWDEGESVRDWGKPLRISLLSLRENWRWVAMAVVPVLVATVILFEARTSEIEARILSSIAAKLSYSMGAGPSATIAFPSSGPFNEARGYAELPGFARRLTGAGFRITAQARLSPELERLAHWGINPPFHDQPASGLIVRGENQAVLYDAGSRERVFKTYEDVPPLLIKTLLLVENRELEDSEIATRNPVVDWGRLGKAGLTYAGHKLGLPVRVEGGSTLATQIEKFRYADGGRTNSPGDKLRQMISASLRVYRDGPDTRAERRDIVLDYINSVPLAAAPEYGEVYGVGNGLYAWFGIDLDNELDAFKDTASEPEKQRILKHAMALICAARAPSFYLLQNHGALEARVDFYIRQLEANGTIPGPFARGLESVRLEFLQHAPEPGPVPYVQRKATNAFRAHLMNVLGVHDLYSLDRLHLYADTTLNVQLQSAVLRLFNDLRDPAFVESHGLRQEHLLLRGDPAQVTYSFTLFERTPEGNVLRVQADTLNEPFDLNEGMKMELGSTAKMRTLAHYLELVASLYEEFHDLDNVSLKSKIEEAQDPITRWTAETIRANSSITLPELLDQAMDRKYSGNPGEVFFTGGGAHVFANFEKEENGKIFTLREALAQSVNLVYIRLMRDLVRFHEARLSYDTNAVLNDPDNPLRQQMLKEIADKESRHFLFEAYESYRHLERQAIIDRVLTGRTTNPAHLAILFLAWNPAADADALGHWLETHGAAVTEDEAAHLFKAYDPGRLNISDYAYLLRRHPLDLWCAGQMIQDPSIGWDDLLTRSADVREVASRWLFQTKNRRAQDLRLRIRIEEDAFARMTPYWQRLGFPFDHLVPSYATAIGSSADRPIALAELVGIIVSGGIRMPTLRMEKLRFAADTPYETVFEPQQRSGERVMDPPVAQALREVLAGVVENGTAKRLAHVFVGHDGTPIMTGGKTGSGDNRYETRTWSRAVSRTGTFAFYIGDRYFGVMTAYVAGDNSGNYVFTSALPVTALKLLAPTLTQSLGNLD
jgi:membrane peptidoglycan carboxypeptidase